MKSHYIILGALAIWPLISKASDVTINFDVDAYGNPISAPSVISATGPQATIPGLQGLEFEGDGSQGGEVVNAVYAGVAAHSGSNVLGFNRSYERSDPELIIFSQPMSQVSIYVSTGYWSFAWTMQALDANDNVLDKETATPPSEGYAPLTVSSTNGIALVLLTCSLPSNDGWGSVTFVCDDLSLTFARPVLQSKQTQQEVYLYWPTWAGSFVLEGSTNLSPAAAWTPITNGIVTNGNNLVFTNSISNMMTFYRLRCPSKTVF